MASKTIATILTLQDKMSGKLVTVSKNVSNMSKEAQKASKQVAAMANGFKAKLDEMSTKAINFSSVMAGALAAGALKSGFSEALDMEGYRVQLETATKDTQKAGEIMKWAVDLANKTPFEAAPLVEGASKLEMMGMNAQKYLPLIGDMAAATNKPVDQAVEALIDSQTGELERLKEFGITKAQVAKKANEMFANQEIINNQGQIVNQEKFNDALMAIMEDRYKGGMDKLSNTTKGVWSTITGITKNALSNIVGMQNDGTIKTGSILDKVKVKIAEVGAKLEEWQSSGVFDSVADKASKAFTIIYNVVSNLINFIVNNRETIGFVLSLVAGFTIATKAIKGFKSILTVLQIAWGIFSRSLALTPIGWVVVAVAALAGAFYLFWTKSATFRSFIGQLLEQIKGFGAYLADVIPPILQKLGDWFTNKVLPVLQSIGDKLLNLWNTVILPFIEWIVSTLAPIFQSIFPIVKQIVMDCFDAIESVIQGALQIFGGIIDFITGVFTGNWSRAWQGLIDIFGGIFKGLSGILKVPLNAAIALINGAIRNINSTIQIDIPDWVPKFGGTHFGLNIPEIPAFANGTKYSSSGLALINEKGGEIRKLSSGETIIPADKSQQLIDKASLGGHIFNIYFNGNVGTEEFFDQAGDHIVKKVKLILDNNI